MKSRNAGARGISPYFRNIASPRFMSQKVLDPELRQKEERMEKPAPRWRNKYWSGIPMQFPLRTVHGEWWGRDIWPSEDICRTKAEEFIAMMEQWLLHCGIEPTSDIFDWLGAFPVEGE